MSTRQPQPVNLTTDETAHLFMALETVLQTVTSESARRDLARAGQKIATAALTLHPEAHDWAQIFGMTAADAEARIG